MNRKKDKSRLTEVELELMNVFWELGEGSVSDVRKRISKSRQMAYTSAATIIRILEEKKFLESRKEGRKRVYSVLIPKAVYESRSLNRLVKRLFDGTPVAMVARLVQEESLSEDELKAMKKLLEERLESE